VSWYSRESLLLWLAAAVFAVRASLALVVVPPWQQPDEPQNVALIRLLKEAGSARPLDELVMRYRGGMRDDPATEPLIVASMVAHRWWEHYGRPVPDPPPTTFAAAGAVVGADFGLPGGGMFYFKTFAAVFQSFRIDALLPQLYLLRICSAACGLLTIWAAWTASRIAFGPFVATAVALVLALHPQFVLVSTAANPDALVNMLGALAWYFAVRGLAGGSMIKNGAGLLTAAIAASLVKRVGVPLLACAGTTIVFFSGQPIRQRLRIMAVTGVGIVAMAFIAWRWAPDEFNRVVASTAFIDERWVLGDLSIMRVWRFVAGLLSSAYLYAGWLRYPSPVPLLVVALIAAALGLAGLCWGWKTANAQSRRAFALAAVFTGVQLLATFAVHFPIGSSAQGRYMFPVMVPFLVLVVGGYSSIPVIRSAHARLAVPVLAAAACDVIGWTLVLLPAYG
jgi:dolichyl-phosphate-mannose-protein mannosyltransferase